MKKNLWSVIIMLSRYFVIGFLVQLAVFTTLFGKDVEAQLNNPVHASLQDVSLKQVFDILKKSAHVTFVYDAGDINGSQKVNIPGKGLNAGQVLDRLAAGLDLSYKMIGNTITVKRKEAKSFNPYYLLLLPIKNEKKSHVDFVAPLTKVFQAQVSGTVKDSLGNPLIGVTIKVKGTNKGTTTDANGYFMIEAPEDATLVFSYVGYQNKEVTINGREKISVTLSISATGLNQVVVIGYGTQRKSDLTGSVGSVSSEALEKRPVTNIGEALSGRIPGVDVAVNSGEPGGATKITIRGATSVSNTNQPLYVIDGVILDMESLQGGVNPISTIDPSNIKSIQVLKDASATAIYGARGANGVVLITTKRGTEGGRLSYHGYVSVSRVARKMDLMNSSQFMKVEDIAYKNAAKFDSIGFAKGNYEDPKITREKYIIGNGYGNPELFDKDLNPLYNTDWQDEAFRTAITQNHSLSFTGGNNQTSFGMYLTYRDEEGVMKNTWLTRYSGRFVIDSRINNWLSVGGTLNYNKQSHRFLEHWGMRAVYQDIPIIPVKWPDGTWAKNETYPGVEGPNQRQVAVDGAHIRNTQNTVGNVFADIQFTKGLTFRTMIAANVIRQGTNSYSGRKLDWVSEAQGGTASISSLHTEDWQFNNILTYNNGENSNHFITAMVGQTMSSTNRFSTASSTYEFLDDYFQYNNLGVGSNPRPSSSSASKYRMASFFGRVNYTHNKKYLLTVTSRVDGSSRFGRNNRFAFFPSGALGWLVSKENFLRDSKVISILKLRSSVGMTGNSEIPNYQYSARLGQYTAIFNGDRKTGIGVSTLANPDLQWEVNTQFDIGVELGLFDGRIYLEGDIYRRFSKNMLLNRPVPLSSGYSVVTQNVGSMRNQGLELLLKTHNVRSSNFSWSTNFNISMNRNKVVKLFDGSEILLGSVPGGTPGSIVKEGLPVNTFVGYIRLGTWGTDEKAQAAVYNRLPGDVKYKDINADGVINSQDWLPIGNGLPEGYGSLVNIFTFKNFELSLDLQFVYGNDIMWEITQVLEDRTGAYNNMLTKVLYNAWTPDNQDTYIAQNKPLAVGYDTKNDTYRQKNGSFIRGRNVLLAYTFPNKLINRWKFKNLRIYISSENFFLISKFPGYDPEVSTVNGQFTRGRSSFDDYPKARTFTFGVQMSL